MESEIKRDPRGYYTLHINGAFEGNYDNYMEAIEAYEKIIYGEKPVKEQASAWASGRKHHSYAYIF